MYGRNKRQKESEVHSGNQWKRSRRGDAKNAQERIKGEEIMIYSYRRVSTEDQLNGPRAQADVIQRWVNGRKAWPDASLTEGIDGDYFDNGISGSVPFAERPVGGKLSKVLASGDVVVTAKLDRMFRSVGDAAVTIADWNKRGITLVAIGEGFDMTNPYGRAMAQMASVFAELEREMIRSRTKAALQSKKAKGERVGEVPYGYDLHGKDLVENKFELSIIQTMFEWQSQGHNARTIAQKLNVLGVSSKKGKTWHECTVRRIMDRTPSFYFRSELDRAEKTDIVEKELKLFKKREGGGYAYIDLNAT